MYSDARICCVCRLVLFDVSSKYRSPGDNGKMRDEKNGWRDGLLNLFTSRFSHFADIFSCSRQFDDKCIAGLNAERRRTTILQVEEIFFSVSAVCKPFKFKEVRSSLSSIYYWVKTFRVEPSTPETVTFEHKNMHSEIILRFRPCYQCFRKKKGF